MKWMMTFSAGACLSMLAACGPGVGGNHGPQLVAATSAYRAVSSYSGATVVPGGQFTLAGYGQAPVAFDAAVNLFVAPNGSDAAAGTEAAPFLTLARAAAAAVPGTTVWVAPGTYAGGFQSTASGMPSARIAFVSTTRWGAKLVPAGGASTGVGWDSRGSDVSVVGFDIDGGAAGPWSHGIYAGGARTLIQDNHVHHIATATACNGAGGSAIGADSYFHGTDQDIVANTVHDIGSANCKYIQGIYMSTSGRVVNNLVYRIGEAAIHLWHDATDVTVANNTVAAARFGIIVGGGDFYFRSAGNNRTTVANNIVVGTGLAISEQGKTGTANRYLNNLVFDNDVALGLRNGVRAVGTVDADPLFVAYSDTEPLPNFRLAPGSPAIGAGTAENAPGKDIDGTSRDGPLDIGAYAHLSTRQ